LGYPSHETIVKNVISPHPNDVLPFGKHTKKLWKITMLSMGKSAISMGQFQ
jgi:hypothetical protein